MVGECVGSGSQVEVVDLKTQRKQRLTVVRDDAWSSLDADGKAHGVTEGSPMGRALEAKQAGDTVEFVVEYGVRKVRIVRVW